MKTYWTGYKPFTAIGLINKILVSTGSPQTAMRCAGADFNGHTVRVSFNERRSYWIAEYIWAGRNVIYRGGFAEAVAAALSFWGKDGEGGSVRVTPQTDQQSAHCQRLGLREWSKDDERADYDSHLLPEVRDAAIAAAHLDKFIPQDFSRFSKVNQ